MTSLPVFPDTTLAMIVRDELMNPAGGLLPMLEHHLPYFSDAVVLDTGSVDGTRQLLEHLQSKYHQLRVYDARFEGYGPARNRAKGEIETTYSFWLDADERLNDCPLFVKEVTKKLSDAPLLGSIYFHFEHILPSGYSDGVGSWGNRLLRNEGCDFSKIVWETAHFRGRGESVEDVRIIHFIPSHSDRQQKEKEWYKPLDVTGKIPFAPSSLSSFPSWKTPNLITLLRYGVSVEQVLTRLGELNLSVHPLILEKIYQYMVLVQPLIDNPTPPKF